ncbi:hypothetical protein [Fibrella forsythiae]|uniref:Uncharacterized protein n=1 Tax=Fibrella forsythiae TaxID=2817061 RepID=A0ABS3JSU7_9BACT|nr:hypothetical protein [Fibrella forsythiae]MBO0953089.1 hypothetical protein [Fibrella forsythiae]
MSLAEEIRGLPLATLLDCREHYERATRPERSPLGRAICLHTLQLINRELTRRMPPLPPMPGELVSLPSLPVLSLPCPLQ